MSSNPLFYPSSRENNGENLIDYKKKYIYMEMNMLSPGKYRIFDNHLTYISYCNSDFHHILIFSTSSFSITNAHYKLKIT